MRYTIGEPIYKDKDFYYILLSYSQLWNDVYHDVEITFKIDYYDIDAIIEMIEFPLDKDGLSNDLKEVLNKYSKLCEIYVNDIIDGYEIRYVDMNGVEFYVEILDD